MSETLKNDMFRSDFIGVSDLKQLGLNKNLTREYIKRLKNPELMLNGQPLPLDKRGPVRSTKKYDQMANPIAAIKNLSSNQDQNNQQQFNDKPKYEIDNSYNIMLLTGAATDTRTIVESFL